jgi:hypothetical protein
MGAPAWQEDLRRLTFIHDALGKELDALGGVLRCHGCKRELPMRGAREYLRSGWPMCCGATMEWLTPRQLALACVCPFPRLACPNCGRRTSCAACAAASENR